MNDYGGWKVLLATIVISFLFAAGIIKNIRNLPASETELYKISIMIEGNLTLQMKTQIFLKDDVIVRWEYWKIKEAYETNQREEMTKRIEAQVK